MIAYFPRSCFNIYRKAQLQKGHYNCYIKPFINNDNIKIYPDGRGTTTCQWASRKCHFLPSDVSEQLESFSFSMDWRKVKIDQVDCSNMSPVIAQVMSRMPGRDIALGHVHAISRATGLPTLPNAIIALDPSTMDTNGLWSEWSGAFLSTQPGWLQQWVFENRPDIFEDPSLHARAFRAWKDRLTGASPPMTYAFAATLQSFGRTTNIRERLAVVLKHLRLHLGSPLKLEGEDDVAQVLDCKRALSHLSKMVCDDDVSRRIEDFLNDPEPKLVNGEPFTKNTSLFERKYDYQGKVSSKKKVMISTSMFLSEKVLAPQDLKKFLNVELEEPLEPCTTRDYVIVKPIKFETSTRRHFHQLNKCITTTILASGKPREPNQPAEASGEGLTDHEASGEEREPNQPAEASGEGLTDHEASGKPRGAQPTS